MEHLEHFGLSHEPFSNDPILRFYFAGRAHADAARRILRGIHQGKGLSLLLGAGGCGKTMLARHLLEELEEDRFEPMLLVMVQRCVDARGLLLRIAGQLGVEDPAEDDGALLGQLYGQLVEIREEGRRSVILVEDAHMLATREAVEGLRGLLSLEHEERRLVSIVLIGTPELEAALALDPSLPERVDIRVRLEALDAGGAAAYVAHRVRTAGGDPGLLDAESVAALHRVAGGVPRMMNTLADNALYEAFLAGRKAVEKEDIERAAHDLGLDTGAVAGDAAPARLLPDDTDGGRGALELALDGGAEDAADLPASRQAVTQVLEDTARDLEDDDLEPTFGLDEDEDLPQAVGPAPEAGSALRGQAGEPSVEAQPVLSLTDPPKDEELDDLFAELIEED